MSATGTGLLHVGEVSAAEQVGAQALTELPNEHRTGIVVSRAREVAAGVPAAAARMPWVRDLREAVMTPTPALPV